MVHAALPVELSTVGRRGGGGDPATEKGSRKQRDQQSDVTTHR